MFSRPAAFERPAGLRRTLWIAGVVALMLPASATSAKTPTIYGSVGAQSIALRNQSGKAVSGLKRGLYVVVVRDRSRRENFHLIGKRFSRKTTSQFVGTVRWRLRLSPGRYTFRSDGADSLQGSFLVK